MLTQQAEPSRLAATPDNRGIHELLLSEYREPAAGGLCTRSAGIHPRAPESGSSGANGWSTPGSRYPPFAASPLRGVLEQTGLAAHLWFSRHKDP